MPRRKRVFKQNSIHHIMLRGVNGHDVFFDRQDYVRFCLILQAACEKHKFSIHGFCFMSNHIHLAIEPLTEEFHLGIHAFAFRYAQYFNQRHDRKGYLFQGRYRSIIVDDGIYIRRLIRYIHLNPVEAKLVSTPQEYSWSSYRAYSQNEQFVWLSTDRVLRKFGEYKNEAIENLVAYTSRTVDALSDVSIILEAHRKGTFEDAVLPEFISIHEPEFVIKTKTSEQNNTPTLNNICNSVCMHFKVEQLDLIGEGKHKSIVDARSVLALIARKTKWWSLEEVSTFLNKNSGTMSRLATRAEAHSTLLEFVENIKIEWMA